MVDATAAIMGHIVLLVTTIGGFIFAWLREGRRHRWQREQWERMNRKMDKITLNGDDDASDQ